MPRSRYRPPLGNPAAIVSPQFCAPYSVDLTIVRKRILNFGVTDVNGNIMFKIKRKCFSLGHRRTLLDAAGNPILTLQWKILTAHRRCRVYRGGSRDKKDLLFSVKKSSLFQCKRKLDVFLAANTKENFCDFKIKGSWFERSCTIYLGDTSTIIAQMHKKLSVQGVLLGKDNFAVTVFPNVDYAFIVALVVVLEEINHKDVKG
ncbi:protein LURP-one-related 15-like [Rhododendron vialii]|uniref:protein LURP-one-related 15-like n=1 Tax=Rhododendron vialii TaxID=182163 RepID=UPI00265FD5FD|nr:protein LURP-one-related 15-like [Rhododendron vialii]